MEPKHMNNVRLVAFVIFILICGLVKHEHQIDTHVQLVPGANTFSMPLRAKEGDMVSLRFSQNSKTNAVVVHFQDATYESSGEDFSIPSVPFFSKLEVESAGVSQAEISFFISSSEIKHIRLILQLVFSFVLIVLWRGSRPHAVAGVALTTVLATISLVLLGERSLVAAGFYAVNVGSTCLTWRRCITGEHPSKVHVGAISGLAFFLAFYKVTRKSEYYFLAVGLLASLSLSFGFLWTRANDKTPHLVAAVAWCLGSVAEIFCSDSLAALLWAEALSVVYVCAVRDAKAEYEGAEMRDLEMDVA